MKLRSFAGLLLLLAALAGALPTLALAGSGNTLDVRNSGGSLGRIPRVVTDDGSGYVSALRLARVLGGAWKVSGTRATLTLGKRSAQFVRNQPQVVVAGQKLGLAAGPRVTAGEWLIPEDFLGKGLARLAPGTAVAAEAEKPKAKPVKAPVALEELRFRSYPSFTRIVVETGAALSYALVSGQGEIRVRLPRLALTEPRVDEVTDGMVKEVRLETTDGDAMLRVLLEGDAGDVKVSTLQDPFRVVVDVYRLPREAPESRRTGPVMEPLRRIVLDAGHGGHDPGASGPTGVQEKDVVLDVTRRVARLVEDELGVKVVLTRSTDVFVPLRERTAMANKQRGDLFVSIHANAHPRAVSEGVEVYFLSSEASDRESRQVAAIENGVIQLESGVSRQKGDVLKTILWDLAQSEFQSESSSMAETVLDSMSQSLRLVPRGVKQAGFYVLGGAAMPAILIEIGFLTNKNEERKLATPEYRAALARAITAGLADYKRRHDQRMRTAQTIPVRAERVR